MYDQSQQTAAQQKAIAPIQGAQQTEYGDAESIAATPYTAYTGTQVAPVTGSQQQAIGQAAADAAPGNAASTDIGQSEALAGQIAGNSWNSATAAKYMNPYTQNVTDVAQKQMQQQYANTINAQNLGAASTGAFGGDRSTLTNENTTGQYLYQSGNLAAQNQAAAYNSAVQTWQADNQRASSAATAYQNAGNDITNMNASQIKDLLSTGGVAQATQQMQLNANYNDYLDQRGWAANELQPLIQATGGKGTPAGVVQPNTASDLLGMGSALAGYYGSTTGSNNNNNTNGTAPMGSESSSGAASGNAAGMQGNSGSFYNNTAPVADSTSSYIAPTYCDAGLKKNIEMFYSDRVSRLPVYAFHYKMQADDEAKWQGYLAQDVQKLYPEAVSVGPKGFLKVHPDRVPGKVQYPMRILSDEDWQTLGALSRNTEE